MAVIAQLHSCLPQPLQALVANNHSKGKGKEGCDLRVDFEAIKVNRRRQADFPKIFDAARPHLEWILKRDRLVLTLAFRLKTKSVQFSDTVNLLLAFLLARRLHSFLILDSHRTDIHDLTPLRQLYDLKRISCPSDEIEFDLRPPHEVLLEGNRLRAAHIGMFRHQLNRVLQFCDGWKLEVHGPVVI